MPCSAIHLGGVFSHPNPIKPGYILLFHPRRRHPFRAQCSLGAQSTPIAVRLTAAGAKKGEADAKPCKACHDFEMGAGGKIGPPLYGVLGRSKASTEGFAHSDALKSRGGSWTYADLDSFLANPKGTKMTNAGENDPPKRADIIAYLPGK